MSRAWIALVAVVLAVARGASADPLVIGEGFTSVAVGRFAELAHDPSGAIGLEEVLAGALRFAPSSRDVPSFGYRAGAEWMHVRVNDARPQLDELVLEHGYGQSDLVEVFEVVDGRVSRRTRGGDHVAPSDWSILARFPAFELKPRGTHDLYVRVSGGASHQLGFTIYGQRDYEAHRRADLVVQSAYFGALGAMALYNALVWLAARGRAYAYYVGFLLSYGVFQLFLAGFGPVLFGARGALCDFVTPLSICLVGTCGLQFAFALLDSKSLTPAWHRLGLVFNVCFAVGISGSCFLGYAMAMRVTLALVFVWAPLMVTLGVSALRQGGAVARLYLSAWTAFLLGTIVLSARAFGVLPSNAITSNAAQFGSVLEFLLLSFALADRIKRLQAEATLQAELAREAAESAKRASEEKAIAEARAAEELRRLDKLKDEFLANTSHELRTPLNGVIGLADSLLEGGHDLPRVATQGIQAILASGKRLDRLVSDILDFSKAKSGELSVTLTAVDLGVAVSEAMLLLAPSVGQKLVRLANDVPANFPLARADETRLAQVLQHVMGNAIKFTDAGEVRVSAERRDGRLALTVKDSGIGVPPEKLATIFAAFEQGDGSATRAHGGTGLGLAFAKQLMDLQGGSIRMASTVGEGTSVTIELVSAPPASQAARSTAGSTTKVRSIPPPALRESLVPAARLPSAASVPSGARRERPPLLSTLPTPAMRGLIAPTTAASPKARTPRVLVADDEPVNLERLEMDLESTGYELVCVDDGQAAIEAFDKQGPFDLVLLDVMMPRVDGLGACRAIRERASAAEVPVLLITAKRETKDLQDGFAAGANDYLTKPYVRQELLERSRSHLATARTTRAMQRFVPGEFAKLLGYQRLDELKLGDCAEKELTVLFLDIHGFTSASERMTSRQVFGWLNDQFGALVPAMRAHGGFVDKFIGDALMGLFAKGSLSAVNAATEAMRTLREKEPMARVGIGIHHGATMLGAIGDDERFSPTVVSDTVNVASRLESLTRRFDARVLLSDETVEAAGIGRGGRTRFLGSFRLKGRAKALRIHELLDAEDPIVAAEKRSAGEFITTTIAELERGDPERAWSLAGAGRELYPLDPVLAFYCDAIGEMLHTGAPCEGVLELREK